MAINIDYYAENVSSMNESELRKAVLILVMECYRLTDIIEEEADG